MSIVLLFWHILIWHYAVAPVHIIKITRDFLWFFYHFFSIPVLMSKLFSKWKRIGEVRHKRLSAGDFLATHFINFVMRIIGFFIRAVTIVAGLISMLLLLCISVAVLAAWLL